MKPSLSTSKPKQQVTIMDIYLFNATKVGEEKQRLILNITKSTDHVTVR